MQTRLDEEKYVEHVKIFFIDGKMIQSSGALWK